MATFLGVHNGLAMGSIVNLGSEEQRRRWLPGMLSLDRIGCFALTEPHGGSDVALGLETTARLDGDEWVIDGAKRWIGNGTFADLVVVFARDVADESVKTFVVEKGTPGFTATKMEGKYALRTVQNADITFDGCRVPAENKLEEGNKLQGRQPGAQADPGRRGLERRRLPDGRVRGRSRLCEGARAVRPPDRRLPDDPGPACADGTAT